MQLYLSSSSKLVYLCFLQILHFSRETPADFPKGHGKSLGKHKDSNGHVDILTTLPSPQEFWDKYVSQRRPALFRGAARSSPGMHLWTDEYMMEHFGDLKVRIESKHQKDGTYPEGEKGIAQDTVRNVLQTYRTRDVYVVSQIPDPLTTQVKRRFYHIVDLWHDVRTMMPFFCFLLLCTAAINITKCLANSSTKWQTFMIKCF